MLFLRKLAAGLLVVVVSSAIFFLLVSDKTTKKNVLRPTLESLGEKLFAAVRTDSSKENLQKNYLDFVKKAEAREIKPEEIEKIAADILNLSIRDSMISSKEAMNIFTLRPDTEVLPPMQMDYPSSYEKRSIIVKPEKTTKPAYDISQEELAERLKKMHEVENKLQKISILIKKNKNIPSDFLYFKADSGLVVEVNFELKKLLEEQDRLLAEQFQELEKKKWLQWQEAIKEKKALAAMIEDSLDHAKNNNEAAIEKEIRVDRDSFRHPREE
ncbi:hypothetical protein JXO59_11290 [candidate division KSB1 bacterium]|nr:hypothetical protein [candidate division KSB1 bacterium]